MERATWRRAGCWTGGLAALATAALAAFLVGRGGPTPPAGAEGGSAGADTTVVDMTNGRAFAPGEITVDVGETVTWRNGSLLVHTVTAVSDSATEEGSVRLPEGAEPFGSGRLGPNATFSHTFETPGTYRYFCIPHEEGGMVGTVHVEEEDG